MMSHLNNSSRKGAAFWPVQLVILIAAVVAACFVFHRVNDLPAVPRLSNQPRTISPQFDWPMVVTDEQLEVVLTKLHPKFPTRPPKTNFVDHALRMWGTQIEFEDGSLSGRQMRELLINDDLFAKVWGESEPALLNETEFGVGVRTQEGRSTVSHVDHLIGTLSEIGTPLDHPIRLNGRDGEVRELLDHMFKSFALNQKEYEWTAVAWAFYADGATSWYTRDRQEITFDSLARRMMRQDQPQGVCYGQHRLYSMTMMLRADDQAKQSGEPLLKSETRAKIIDYLKSMTAALYRNQSVEGYWDANWPDSEKPIADPQTNPLSRRILATGHTLEWWAMAPAELHPPRETVARAGQWLARVIGEMEPNKVEKNYTFLTHAARALALWRGKLPDQAEFELRIHHDHRGPLTTSIKNSSQESERHSRPNGPVVKQANSQTIRK